MTEKVYTKPELIKLKGKDKKQAITTYKYAEYCQIIKRLSLKGRVE